MKLLMGCKCLVFPCYVSENLMILSLENDCSEIGRLLMFYVHRNTYTYSQSQANVPYLSYIRTITIYLL